MKLSKVLKILNSHDWKEEEAKASFHNLTHWGACYVSSYLAYRRKLFSIAIYYSFTKDYYHEATPVDEAKETFNWAFQKYNKNKRYFSVKISEFENVMNRIRKHFSVVNKGIKNFSNQELYNTLSTTLLLGRKQYSYSIIPESADVLEEKDFLSVLPNLKEKVVSKTIQILSQPQGFVIMDRERLSFLDLAKKVMKNQKIKTAVLGSSIKNINNVLSFKKKLENHVKNFFWIHNTFYKAEYLDKKYFLNELKKFIKQSDYRTIHREWQRLKNKPNFVGFEQKKYIKKYRLSGKAKAFFGLLQLFTRMQDERKEAVQRQIYIIDQLLSEMVRRRGLKRSDLDYYTIKETLSLIKNYRIINQNVLKKRKKNIVLLSLLKNGQMMEYILSGKQARSIIKFFDERKKVKAREGIIKGFVASIGLSPRVSGRVRIVLEPSKIKDFRKGDILVAGMTRPEFVPLMRKARAVITNEGGITTHAAIVSRELNIPCIIGTKIATRVLKDGDKVEMDLEKGTVKKL